MPKNFYLNAKPVTAERLSFKCKHNGARANSNKRKSHNFFINRVSAD